MTATATTRVVPPVGQGIRSAALEASVAGAANVLRGAREVVLLAHVQPDADALGSALALGIALHRRGVRVTVSFGATSGADERVPESLRSLDEYGLLVPAAEVPAAPEVLVACDTADIGRLGSLAGLLDTAGTSILVDHHASNPGFGTVRVLDPAAEATVMLVRRVLAALGEPLDAVIGRCLYAGLATDTVGFRTAGPGAHRLAAELVEAGVEVEPLIRRIVDTHPFSWLQALAGLLADARLEPDAAGGRGLVHTSVPAAVVAAFGQEEVESVVGHLRTAAEADVAAVFKQVGPQRWALSLRGKGSVDLSAVAVALGGGGHHDAAGAVGDGDLAEVRAALRAALTAVTG
ncbi:DHH family phosphoesterase [Pseudonocardia sp. T1-2H]|uniref:DHH family phosphoesterase n=1 Tax=Pseudonocardia sp. T1-2H TaxID=3128899 RepID=UPI0031016F1D